MSDADAIVREELDAYNARLFEQTGERNSEHSSQLSSMNCRSLTLKDARNITGRKQEKSLLSAKTCGIIHYVARNLPLRGWGRYGISGMG